MLLKDEGVVFDSYTFFVLKRRFDNHHKLIFK